MTNTNVTGIPLNVEHLHLGYGLESETYVSIHIFCFNQETICVCPNMWCGMIIPKPTLGKCVSPELRYAQSTHHHFSPSKWPIYVSPYILRRNTS